MHANAIVTFDKDEMKCTVRGNKRTIFNLAFPLLLDKRIGRKINKGSNVAFVLILNRYTIGI